MGCTYHVAMLPYYPVSQGVALGYLLLALRAALLPNS